MDDFRAREALYYLIGRRLLEGVEPQALADRLSITAEEVAEGWRVSQEQLSLDLAMQRGERFRTLSREELREEIDHCLRRLLEWREQMQQPFTAARARSSR